MTPHSDSEPIEPMSPESAHVASAASVSEAPSGSDPRTHQSLKDQVIICGLGSLGQHCALQLKEFGVRVNAIELYLAKNW